MESTRVSAFVRRLSLTVLAATFFAIPVARGADAPAVTPAPPSAPAMSPTPSSTGAPRSLRVLTYDDPPFSMRDANGHWSGLAIELWQDVAQEMGVTYQLDGLDSPAEILARIQRGEADVVAAAVPITLDQVRDIEFSNAWLQKWYAIATVPASGSGWIDALGGPLASRLRDVLAASVAVLLLGAFGIWWVERRRNPGHFGGNVASGVGEGLWWAATTMTTVGYGDRTPVTLLGRLFAVLLMFLSLILVSIATGIIASRLTVVELQPQVVGLSDLGRVRVGVVRGSAMEVLLKERSIAFQTYEDIDIAADALVAQHIDALVAGDAELSFLAANRLAGKLAIVPGALDEAFLAFALPPGSPLRRDVNTALGAVLESDGWRQLRQGYLQR